MSRILFSPCGILMMGPYTYTNNAIVCFVVFWVKEEWRVQLVVVVNVGRLRHLLGRIVLRSPSMWGGGMDLSIEIVGYCDCLEACGEREREGWRGRERGRATQLD